MVGCYLVIPLKSINAKPFSILIIVTICIYGLSSLNCHSKWLGSRRCGSSQIINFFYGFLVCSFVHNFQNSNEISCFRVAIPNNAIFAVFTLNVLDSQNTVDKKYPLLGSAFIFLCRFPRTRQYHWQPWLLSQFFYLSYQSKIKNQIFSLIFTCYKRSRPIANNFACYLSFCSFVGILTGMSVEYLKSGKLITIDHKTVLSFCTLALISLLLITNKLFGLRGRFLSRLILVAYFLISLGYLGVKVISQYLL